METFTTAPATTTLGTPASPKWEPDWLAEVDRVETELGHRICGAHSPAWTPCKLASTHPNGRCRFHGGAPGIGAPGGNRNAWIHGLYSRRIQQCGDHCPLWTHCPMAGKDVLTLSPPERPHCVYEQDEYESILSVIARSAPVPVIARSEVATKQSLTPEPSTSSPEKEKVEPKEINAEAKSSNSSEESQLSDGVLRASASPREPGLIESNIALFQVLLSRAQAALGVARLTDDTRARTLNYQMHSTKIAALVQAQLHIARELRHWLKLLPTFDPWRGLRSAKTRGPSIPPKDSEPEGLPTRMMKLLEETDGALEEVLGIPYGDTPFKPRLNKHPNPSPA